MVNHDRPSRTRRYSRLTDGAVLAKDPVKYSGVSTPVEKRNDLGIKGLVPAAYIPLELDVQRCMENLRSKATPLEKYIYLATIQDVSERLYYGILVSHTAEVMPIVYTPTGTLTIFSLWFLSLLEHKGCCLVPRHDNQNSTNQIKTHASVPPMSLFCVVNECHISQLLWLSSIHSR